MSSFSTLPKLRFATALLALVIAGPCLAEIQVDATSRPGKKWQARPTTLLTDLPPIHEDRDLDIYGGMKSDAIHGSGFFRTARIEGRWWLITPDGGRFISRGVNSVNQPTTDEGRQALSERFGDTSRWAAGTQAFLTKNGINTLGAWSAIKEFSTPSVRLPETLIWNFMASYGRKRGGIRQDPGHTGYPADCPFIFDADFAPFCEKYASQLAPFRNDPWIIGHFSDNEMPWSRKMLENYLSLAVDDAGHLAAAAWLRERKEKKPGAITEEDRTAFLKFALTTYLTTVKAAMRKHAPDHLFLGPRLHGAALRLPEVFEALGTRVDVVSANYYGAWTPDAKLLEMWSQRSGKPILITEFYAKGEDSGMSNTSGAGWLVKSQRDRGAFYQNFTLGLIRSRVCVGWSWHRYADNDPKDKRLDPSNRDSNKGIVSNRYVPFPDLLEAMSAINRRTYGIVGQMDSNPR